MGRLVVTAQPGQLARRFVGLGAAVAKERLPAKCGLVQSLGELDLRLRVKRVANVPEFVGLIGRGAHQGRMTMPENPAAKPGEHVQIFAAVGIPDAAPFAARHHHRHARVIVDQHLLGPVKNRVATTTSASL